MSLTSGFQVQVPLAAAPLRGITMPEVHGVDPNSFRTNLGAAFVQGVAAGKEATQGIVDALDPVKRAERKLALAKIPVEMGELDYKKRLLDFQTSVLGEGGFHPQSEETVAPAAPSTPAAGQEASADSSEGDASITDQKSSPAGFSAKISMPGAGAKTPIAGINQPGEDPKNLTAPTSTEVQTPAAAQEMTPQSKAAQLKREEDDYNRAMRIKNVVGAMDPNATAWVTSNDDLRKRVTDLNGDWRGMTRKEQMALVQSANPLAMKAMENGLTAAKEYNATDGVKYYKVTSSALNQMLETAKNKNRSGADDLALINNFITSAAPNGTVRPIEIETIESATPVLAQLGLKIGKILPQSNGNLLTSAQVAQMIQAAKSQVIGRRPAAEAEHKEAIAKAKTAGFDPKYIGELPEATAAHGSTPMQTASLSDAQADRVRHLLQTPGAANDPRSAEMKAALQQYDASRAK